MICICTAGQLWDYLCTTISTDIFCISSIHYVNKCLFLMLLCLHTMICICTAGQLETLCEIICVQLNICAILTKTYILIYLTWNNGQKNTNKNQNKENVKKKKGVFTIKGTAGHLPAFIFITFFIHFLYLSIFCGVFFFIKKGECPSEREKGLVALLFLFIWPTNISRLLCNKCLFLM